MIVNKCVTSTLLKKCIKTVSVTPSANIYNRALIGNRDWVGFGYNGAAVYVDSVQYPCPSIRFKENTNELLALREKEKGDWRKLTLEEKKTLYRASFRQTLTEVVAPTGQWKSVIGFTLMLASVGLWVYIFMRLFVYHPGPKTISEEHRKAMLRKALDLRMNPMSGAPKHWDYENDDFKK